MDFDTFCSLPDELKRSSGWLRFRDVGNKRILLSFYDLSNSLTPCGGAMVMLRLSDKPLGKNEGLGFVLSHPFIVLVLTSCFEPESECVEGWASEIIGLLKSYAEVVEKNIHIWCKCEIAEQGKIVKAFSGLIEVLTTGFVPVSGKEVVGVPKSLVYWKG